MALAKAAWRDFELNNAALSFSVILVGRNEQDGYLKDRASETPEDIRVRKHYEGVTLIEKLCKECGADMRLIAAGAKLVRYDRIRDWYLADVRSLLVHAPTLLMAVPGAEWDW